LCVTIETKEIAIKYMYTKKVFMSLLTKPIPSDTLKTHMLSLEFTRFNFGTYLGQVSFAISKMLINYCCTLGILKCHRLLIGLVTQAIALTLVLRAG